MAGDRIKIGNVEVIAASDGGGEVEPSQFLPAATPQDWEPYRSYFSPEGRLRINFGSFVLRSGGRTLLVDTGIGPGPNPLGAASGRLLDDLRAKGIRPEEIDLVVHTHLHFDHTGWNITEQAGKPQPTFSRAQYAILEAEWSFFSQVTDGSQYSFNPAAVMPLKELGVLRLVKDSEALTDEVTILATPGHTPGHISLLVTSAGERGVILGDVMHHPVQTSRPDLSIVADIDTEKARQTRQQLVERLEAEGLTFAAGHFPTPGFGRIVRLESRRHWQAL